MYVGCVLITNRHAACPPSCCTCRTHLDDRTARAFRHLAGNPDCLADEKVIVTGVMETITQDEVHTPDMITNCISC